MGKLINRARMTVASAPGTGVITLGSAVAGNQSFAAAGIADGDVVSYVAESGYSNGVPSVWEYGQGTYAASGTTLTRTTVQGGTSGTSPVTLTADAQVFVSPLAADIGPQRSASVATTSGVAVDFTGIPSTAKRITVILNGVSTNGSSLVQIQLGSGSPTTSGYDTRAFNWTGGTAGQTLASGFPVESTASSSAAASRIGTLRFENLGSNNWVGSGIVSSSPANGNTNMIAGAISLAGVLDRIRLTTVNGTDAFDAGAVTIMWE